MICIVLCYKHLKICFIIAKKIRNYRTTQCFIHVLGHSRFTLSLPESSRQLRTRRQQKAEKTGRNCWIRQGYFQITQVDKPQEEERYHLLREEIQAGEEEERVSRAAGLCAQSLEPAINNGKHQPPNTAVCFVKAGEKPQAQARSTTALLPTAWDRQLQADILTTHRNNLTPFRHDHHLRDFQTPDHAGTDSRQREKTSQE